MYVCMSASGVFQLINPPHHHDVRPPAFVLNQPIHVYPPTHPHHKTKKTRQEEINPLEDRAVYEECSRVKQYKIYIVSDWRNVTQANAKGLRGEDAGGSVDGLYMYVWMAFCVDQGLRVEDAGGSMGICMAFCVHRGLTTHEPRPRPRHHSPEQALTDAVAGSEEAQKRVAQVCSVGVTAAQAMFVPAIAKKVRSGRTTLRGSSHPQGFTPSVDGWMDGWMDRWMVWVGAGRGAVCSGTDRPEGLSEEAASDKVLGGVRAERQEGEMEGLWMDGVMVWERDGLRAGKGRRDSGKWDHERSSPTYPPTHPPRGGAPHPRPAPQPLDRPRRGGPPCGTGPGGGGQRRARRRDSGPRRTCQGR